MADAIPGRAVIRNATLARLRAALPELAESIYTARAWPVHAEDQPAMLVYMFDETKRSFGAFASPAFQVSATLALHVKLDASDEIACEAAMDAYAARIEDALLRAPAWMTQLEDVSSWVTNCEVKPGGERPTAQLTITASLSWQERFEPIVTGRLGEARIAVDAVHPFDAAGTYPPIDGLPSAAAAPRTAGPDGRAESTLRLTFPTA